MIGVTFDTSVLVASLNSRGAGSNLLRLARTGAIRLDTSEPIVDETIRVLRERFQWNPYRLHALRDTLAATANWVHPRLVLTAVERDPSDNRIVECAVEAQSRYIVTWDADLLDLGTFAGVEILRPPQLLAALEAEQGGFDPPA